MADLSVNIGKLALSNPVMTASGTFGYGLEFQDFVDLEKIGGIIVKGTTLHHREGNPYPRMAETPMGMLNAVGLQNKGVHYFVDHIYPQIKDIRTNMIVNVSGSQIEDYAETASIINELDCIPAIELNISCPNVKQGGMAFGVTAHGAAEVVSAVRKVYHKTLIVKLSPNVTDITEIARAVEGAGADSVSLINTLLGMASCQSGEDSGYRIGRNHECTRCGRIFACRSDGNPNRYCQFHQSGDNSKSGRRHQRVPRPSRFRFGKRYYRCIGSKLIEFKRNAFFYGGDGEELKV